MMDTFVRSNIYKVFLVASIVVANIGANDNFLRKKHHSRKLSSSISTPKPKTHFPLYDEAIINSELSYHQNKIELNGNSTLSHRSLQRDIASVTVSLVDLRMIMTCVTNTSFSNGTIPETWQWSMNKYMQRFYTGFNNGKGIDSPANPHVYNKEFYVSTILKDWEEYNGLDVLVNFEMEIFYRTQLVNGVNKIKEAYPGVEIATAPWSDCGVKSTILCRNQFANFLAEQATAKAFDRVCPDEEGSFQVTCVAFDKACLLKRQNDNISNEWVFKRTRDFREEAPRVRRTERFITMLIFGIPSLQKQPTSTPQIWDIAANWADETDLYIRKFWEIAVDPENKNMVTTLKNVMCDTTVVATADALSFDSTGYYDGRALSNTESQSKSLVHRSLEFEGVFSGIGGTEDIVESVAKEMSFGIFIVYKQRFEFTSTFNDTLSAETLALRPFNITRGRVKYVQHLKSRLRSEITDISLVTADNPGSTYVYNAAGLVMAISPSFGLNAEQDQKEFEEAINKHIVDYWTKIHKWAAIFDLKAKAKVVNIYFGEDSNSLFGYEDFVHIQYEVHFHYRSMYDGNYLEPQRVALEPLQAEFGYQKFISDIGWNRDNDKIDRKILFAGNFEDWITFEKTLAKPPMSSMLLTIITCCILSVLIIVVVISRKYYLSFWDKQGKPTMDENSLGECYSYGESVDKTAQEEEKLKLGANQFETDTEDGKKFRHIFIMKNDDDAEKDDADGFERRISSFNQINNERRRSSYDQSQDERRSSSYDQSQNERRSSSYDQSQNERRRSSYDQSQNEGSNSSYDNIQSNMID